jgi:2-hydroxychromene-2-carboxylate isomerase
VVTQTFDFFYDFGSPYTYLVHKLLPDIEARAGATATYKPMLLGGVFKATGNMSPIHVPSKLAYQTADIARCVQHHGLSYLHNPHFPVMTISLMRGAIFAAGKPYEKTYIDTVFDAMWIEGRKMDDPETIFEVLSSADLPAAEIIAGTQEPQIKSALIAATQDAVDRGAFGAPTLFVDSEMFFGKDALLDLERALL